MAREIKIQQGLNQNQSGNNNGDSYKEKLVKLIPSEIITAYITFYNIIKGFKSQNETLLLCIVIGLLLIATPMYLKRFSGVTQKKQLLFTTIGFLIWAITIGSPINKEFSDVPISSLASLVLMGYTLFIPWVYGKN